MRLTVTMLSLLIISLAHADGIYRDKDGKYAGMWRGNDVSREYFGPDWRLSGGSGA